MTEKQSRIIEQSWDKILIYNTELGDIFYYELFAKAPELKSIFKEDAKERSRKLLFAVVSLATKVHKLESIDEDVKAMAKRHIRYGAKPEYFDVFGQAFLKGLENIFQDEWNSPYKDAWTELYKIVSNAMKKNMKEILVDMNHIE